MSPRYVTALLLALLIMPGCGEEDLLDDSLPSDAQVRSLVVQFEEAVEAGDDEAACELMSGEMRENLEGSALVDGELRQVSCGVATALANPATQQSSLPGAAVVYVAVNRHDDGAEVQLDNGTRLRLERGGGEADGEWRIDSARHFPSPADWEGRVNPLSPRNPRAAARRVAACLAESGFDSKVVPTQGSEAGAAHATVTFKRDGANATGGQIAIFEPDVEAIDKLEGLESAIPGFNGVSEPRGRAGVIFFTQPKAETFEAALDCVR